MRARVVGFRAREGPHGVEAGPRGSPKTEFCKITPPVRSGGPQRAPQHKILQNYAPREGPRASKGPSKTKFPLGPPSAVSEGGVAHFRSAKNPLFFSVC